LIKDQIKTARLKMRELESLGQDTETIILEVAELQKQLQDLTVSLDRNNTGENGLIVDTFIGEPFRTNSKMG